MISILRNIKMTQYKHKLRHFYLNHFLHVAFTAIFEAFFYTLPDKRLKY